MEYSGTQKYAERRNYERVPLDAPCFASIHKDEQAVQVLMVDCSRGGMQFALPPGREVVADWLGNAVRVGDLPGALDPSGEGLEAMVNWVGGGRCGVRFDRVLSLSEAELLVLVQGL